jgi:hypothetical protein
MEQYATAGVLSAHVPSLGAGAGKRNEVSKMQNYRNAKLFVKTGESNNMTLTKHYKNQARPPSPPTPTPPPTPPHNHTRHNHNPPTHPRARHATPRHCTPRSERLPLISLAWTWQSLNF